MEMEMRRTLTTDETDFHFLWRKREFVMNSGRTRSIKTFVGASQSSEDTTASPAAVPEAPPASAPGEIATSSTAMDSSSSSSSVSEHKYDYDLIVIGGGSGGLAASKEAAKSNPNLRVACFDYIKPSPLGTTWGLGGTCVNVGCIPKKLMHYSGLLKMNSEDARALGWETMGKDDKHNWKQMQSAVGALIKSMNYNYKVELKENRVNYINAYASFTDAHTVEYEQEVKDGDKKAIKTFTATADKVDTRI